MTISIFVLKGDLNGKIVVVRFFFCRVYFNNPLNFYMTLSSADKSLLTVWTQIRNDRYSVQALSGSRLFDTLKVMTS